LYELLPAPKQDAVTSSETPVSCVQVAVNR